MQYLLDQMALCMWRLKQLLGSLWHTKPTAPFARKPYKHLPIQSQTTPQIYAFSLALERYIRYLPNFLSLNVNESGEYTKEFIKPALWLIDFGNEVFAMHKAIRHEHLNTKPEVITPTPTYGHLLGNSNSDRLG